MSEAWERCHRRYQLTQAVLAEVARTGSPTITTTQRVQIEAEYGALATFLQELQSRWYRLFAARLDAILETDQTGTDAYDAAVRQLWRQLTTEQRPMWLLLQAHQDHPALVAGETAHRASLRAAGITDLAFTTEPETRTVRNIGSQAALSSPCRSIQ